MEARRICWKNQTANPSSPFLADYNIFLTINKVMWVFCLGKDWSGLVIFPFKWPKLIFFQHLAT
jgi:hypothetical protein